LFVSARRVQKEWSQLRKSVLGLSPGDEICLLR
jgi:hypothetical protein